MGETLTGRKALMHWCQEATEGYPNVNVINFTTSWKDGLAFCAIVHRYRPDLIDFGSLKKQELHRNLQIAFDAAEVCGIPRLLDVEDVADLAVPDSFSVITYLAQFFQAFSKARPQTIGPFKPTENTPPVKNQVPAVAPAKLPPSPAITLAMVSVTTPSSPAPTSSSSLATTAPSSSSPAPLSSSSSLIAPSPSSSSTSSLTPVVVQAPSTKPSQPTSSSTATTSSPSAPTVVESIEIAPLKRTTVTQPDKVESKKTESVIPPSIPSSSKPQQQLSSIVDKTEKKENVPTASPIVPEPSPSTTKKTSFVPANGTIDPCSVCGKRVYLMERINAAGMIIHKGCFKCQHCQTPLTMATFQNIERELYCNPHFNLIQQIGKQQYEKMRQSREEETSAKTKSDDTLVVKQEPAKEIVQESKPTNRWSTKPLPESIAVQKEEIKPSEPIKEIQKEKAVAVTSPAKEVPTPIKEIIKEPAKELTKEPVKEPIKEHVKEPVKELVKEPSKESVKEPAKEFVKEPVKQAIKEPAKEIAKELVKDQKKEADKPSTISRASSQAIMKEMAQSEVVPPLPKEAPIKPQRSSQFFLVKEATQTPVTEVIPSETSPKEEKSRFVRRGSADVLATAEVHHAEPEVTTFAPQVRPVSPRKEEVSDTPVPLPRQQSVRQSRDMVKQAVEETPTPPPRKRESIARSRQEKPRVIEQDPINEPKVDRKGKGKDTLVVTDPDAVQDIEELADKRELKAIEKKQADLQARGNALEQQIRKKLEANEDDGSVDTMYSEWFELIRSRNEIVFREEELRLRQEGRKLARMSESVESSIRDMLQKSQSSKTTKEIEQEEWLVKEWLSIVQKRDELIQLEEDLRVRMEQENSGPTQKRRGATRNQQPARSPSTSKSSSRPAPMYQPHPTKLVQQKPKPEEQPSSCIVM